MMNSEVCGNCSYAECGKKCGNKKSTYFNTSITQGNCCREFRFDNTFTWDEEICDAAIYNGETILICDIEDDELKRLVRDLSYCSSVKFDYYYSDEDFATYIKTSERNFSRGSKFVREHLSEIIEKYHINNYL